MAETTATTKALTLAQPWATLVAIGVKRIETRSWKTNYRGDIAIHAGKGLVASGGRSGLIGLCNTMHFQQALYEGDFITHNHCDFDAMPTAKMEFGSIIAIAELHDIRPTTEIADSISQCVCGCFILPCGSFKRLEARYRPQPQSTKQQLTT